LNQQGILYSFNDLTHKTKVKLKQLQQNKWNYNKLTSCQFFTFWFPFIDLKLKSWKYFQSLSLNKSLLIELSIRTEVLFIFQFQINNDNTSKNDVSESLLAPARVVLHSRLGQWDAQLGKPLPLALEACLQHSWNKRIYMSIGNFDTFHFTFKFEVQMWVRIYQKFEKDQIPICHLSKKWNLITDKPTDFQIRPNIN